MRINAYIVSVLGSSHSVQYIHTPYLIRNNHFKSKWISKTKLIAKPLLTLKKLKEKSKL